MYALHVLWHVQTGAAEAGNAKQADAKMGNDEEDDDDDEDDEDDDDEDEDDEDESEGSEVRRAPPSCCAHRLAAGPLTRAAPVGSRGKRLPCTLLGRLA